MIKRMRKLVFFVALFLCVVFVRGIVAAPYGTNKYSQCTYGNGCSISITTSTSVDLPLTPTAAGVYTIEKDEVTVTTNVSSGYELRVSSTSATDNSLVAGSNEISATSGSLASPTVLDMNSWGYRVDSIGGFGVGPTAALQNQPVNSALFAAIPLLGDEDVVRTTGTSTPLGELTTVWYGVHANLMTPPGSYTGTVLYTAVAL